MTPQTTLAAALLIAASLAVVGIWLMRMVLTEPEATEAQTAEAIAHHAELRELNRRVDAEEAEWERFWQSVPRDNVRYLPLPLRSVPVQRKPGSAS